MVELGLQDLLPSQAASARRSRETKEVGGVGNSGDRSGLNRGSANFLKGEIAEEFSKTINSLVEQRQQGLWCAIASGQTGSSRSQNNMDCGISDPIRNDSADLVDVIRNQTTVGQLVASLLELLAEIVSGGVVGQRSGIADRQDGNAQSNEFSR